MSAKDVYWKITPGRDQALIQKARTLEDPDPKLGLFHKILDGEVGGQKYFAYCFSPFCVEAHETYTHSKHDAVWRTIEGLRGMRVEFVDLEGALESGSLDWRAEGDKGFFMVRRIDAYDQKKMGHSAFVELYQITNQNQIGRSEDLVDVGNLKDSGYAVIGFNGFGVVSVEQAVAEYKRHGFDAVPIRLRQFFDEFRV